MAEKLDPKETVSGYENTVFQALILWRLSDIFSINSEKLKTVTYGKLYALFHFLSHHYILYSIPFFLEWKMVVFVAEADWDASQFSPILGKIERLPAYLRRKR